MEYSHLDANDGVKSYQFHPTIYVILEMSALPLNVKYAMRIATKIGHARFQFPM